MNIYISNNIRVEHPTQELINWANYNLRFPNPEYAKKQAMGKWVGNTPKEIVLYQRRGEDLLLPFGAITQLYFMFKDTCQFYPNFKPLQALSYNSRLTLYDYQEVALNRLKMAKNGILVAPCGSGKTNIGLQYIATMGGKALWITHTLDLLNQSKARAMANFDLPATAYGIISDGKVNIGTHLTFATAQTLSTINLLEYINEWDVIVVDEATHCVGSPAQAMMFYRVLSHLCARYKVGLTATPYRADHLEKTMFALLGDIAYEIPKSAVRSKTCRVEVRTYNTNYTPNIDNITLGDGSIVYASLVEDIVSNKARNEYIASIVNNLQGQTLILTDRLDHENALQGQITRTTAIINGNTKGRENILQDFKNGKIEVIIASYKLAKEGLDVPTLRYVVLATPQKDKSTIIQSCGRVERKADGKEKGIVIDFVDNFGLLKKYYKKRVSYYKAQGYYLIENYK